MNCNKLHVNLEKSCYMYFNNTRKSENAEKLNKFVLKISNTSLPQVEHTKFLGVIIDNKLTWQPHLSLYFLPLYHLSSLVKTVLLHRKIESHFTIHSLKPPHKPLSHLI